MPRIRKRDVSPEDWAAHKAREKTKAEARSARWAAKHELERREQIETRRAKTIELRNSWHGLRSAALKVRSLGPSFMRFENALLAFLMEPTLNDEAGWLDELLDNPDTLETYEPPDYS